MIGKTVGPYRIEGELGRGGMGVVYRATDTRLGRSVALKFLPEELARSPQALERLRQEARAASALNHPHVCTIHEIGEEAGRAYIVMEHIEGRPLSRAIPEQGLPAETVVRCGAQVADALAHAHARGVIHRDLKSPNILLTQEGRAKVLDFGLAAHSPREISEVTRSQLSIERSEGIVGTLHYLPPEVLRGEPADARSDIWSLGVVLFEMAAGRLPFQGRTGFEVSSAILREAPAEMPAHVPPGLRAVIQRCLAKEPGQRYQQAGEVRAALEAIESDSAVRVAAPSARRARRVRAGLFLAAGALVTFAGLLGWKMGWGLRGKGADAEKIQSVAVLPLKTVAAQKGEEHLGLGIADTIITKVSQISGLTVSPSSAVRKYAAQEVDALEAARQLRVDAVLDGTLQRSGDRLRVNLNLLRTRDGASLWSESFNTSMADIFDLQDQVAQRVADGLRMKLTDRERAMMARHDTENAEAYEFYLKGAQSFSRRGLTAASRADLDGATAAFKRAIELDPRYARAHAQLAYCYVWMALFTDPGPRWMEEARKEIRRTEELDPNLAELHLVRHEIYWSAFEGFRVADAARELLQALKLSPGVGHEQLGVIFAHMGLENASLSNVRRAMEHDTSSEINQARMVEVFDLLYRPDEAIATNAGFGNLPGPAFYLRKSYLWKNRFDLAEQENQRQLARNPAEPFTLSNRALLAALRGRYKEAEAAIPGVVRASKDSRAFHHVAYNAASIYALQGQAGPAVEWLKKTVEAGMPNYTLFSRDPHLDRIRSDPAFVAFMNELKPRWEAYAREFGN